MNTCLNCGKPVSGRSDKKFCDLGCKSAYSNKQKKVKEEFVLRVNKQLRVNWKILKTINPKGTSRVRKSFLEGQGFDFKYFTNIYKTTTKGEVYYFTYDVGFKEISSTHVCIVNWQDYMDDYQIPVSIYEDKS